MPRFSILNPQHPMPATAYGYARFSHDDQKDEDTLPRQIAAVQGYHDLHLKPRGIAWGTVEYDQFAVSAFKKPFSRRPAGLRLLGLLKPGDHVIFDKIDRIWRRSDDLVDLMRLFNERKITVHFVSFRGCSLELNTPMGDFFLTVMVAIAQLEAQTISARNKEHNEFRRLAGKVSQKATFGWTVEGYKNDRVDTRRIVEDEEAMGILKQIYELRESGLSIEQVTETLERERCDKAGIPFNKYQSNWKWKRQTVRDHYVKYRILLLWRDEVGGFEPVHYRFLDAITGVATILRKQGEVAARAEIRRLQQQHQSRATAFLHNSYSRRRQIGS